MKPAYISTYPPRQCGIATFNNNLIKAISSNLTNQSKSSYRVIAINDEDSDYQYPLEVDFIVRQNFQRDYINAANFINHSDSDLCILQHEFGIYGGEGGIYILPLIHRLKVPLIVILHTVLKEPSFTERSIIHEIGIKARKIIVMNNLAVEFLENIYEVPEDKIQLIEHGVPDFSTIVKDNLREKLKLDDKKVIFTFGLLSRNKGIETVINALPKVVQKHPDVLYIVLGNTHPNVLSTCGEDYRDYLNLLVKKNGLENHVVFLNKFVSEETLAKYLSAIDIYITPYLNVNQITSGTLSYAIGAGAAVISTPYWHAREILKNNRGILFNFKDSIQLANILIELLDSPHQLKEYKKRALKYGEKLKWPLIGKQYLELADATIKNFAQSFVKDAYIEKPLIDLSILPVLNFSHLKRLTDDTGIVQHAKYGIPNLKEGYCLDDNSRALLAALMAYHRTKDTTVLKLIPIYFSYLHYMQNLKGTFRNFLSFNRQFLDEEGSEDAFGRTMWALGYFIRFAPNDAYYQLAEEIFSRAVPNCSQLRSVRGIANTLIGISYFLQRFQSDELMITLLKKLADKLIDKYYENESDDWHWFENIMSYDNAILPLALYHVFEITDDRKYKEVADTTTNFLELSVFKKGYLTPVGNNGWYSKGGNCAQYGQQATDVMAMVLLYYQAFLTTKKKEYIKKMYASFTWFLGENDLRIPLYDHETNGCCDGLESYGVNRNQGAESTLAYLISHMTVLNALDHEHEYEAFDLHKKKKLFVAMKEAISEKIKPSL